MNLHHVLKHRLGKAFVKDFCISIKYIFINYIFIYYNYLAVILYDYIIVIYNTFILYITAEVSYNC